MDARTARLYWNLAGAAIGIRFSEVGLLFASARPEADDGIRTLLMNGTLALAYLIIATLITLLYVDYDDVAKLAKGSPAAAQVEVADE